MLRFAALSLDEQSLSLYRRFVPAHHSLRQMDDTLNFSFILPLVAHRYNPWIGRPAEHPEQMWRLLFAQFYLNLSDEKIILATHTDLAERLFIRLNAGEKPPHPSTLQKFRFNRLKEGDYLNIHFALLKQAQDKGLLAPKERQIFDTTHVFSNTKVTSVVWLLLSARNRLIKEVKTIDPAYGTELEAQAQADKEAYKAERDQRQEAGEPKQSKEEKIASAVRVANRYLREVRTRVESGQLEATERLNVALAVLDKVIQDRDAKATDRVVSVHDEEARKGRKGGFSWDGRKLAFNMQEESRLITACDMAPGNTNDCRLLEPLLDQQKKGLDMVPPELSADKGADFGFIRSNLRARGIQGHIPITTPTNSEGKDLYKVADFQYDPVARAVTCPAGQTTQVNKRAKVQSREGQVYSFRQRRCQGCELLAKCRNRGKKKLGREVYISLHWESYEGARKHNQTAEFREAYGRRGRVEGKVWELVQHGGRRCRYRGNERGRMQLLVVVSVVNGKRLCRLLAPPAVPRPRQRGRCDLRAS